MEWYILVLGTILFSAFGSVIEKRTLFKEHAMEFCTVFALFISIFSLPLIPFLDFSFPRHYWSILIGIAFLDAIAFLHVAKATRHMELSESSPLLTFGPVFTMLLAFLFLNESLSTTQIVGIFLIICGSYILELKPKKKSEKEIIAPFKTIFTSKYIHYIFIALVLYATTSVTGRFLLNVENPNAMDPKTLIFLVQIFIAVFMVIFISIFHDGIKGIIHGIKNAGKWIAAMAVLLLGSRLFIVYAMTIPAAKIALIVALKRTSALLSTLFGGKLFHEKRLKQKTFAAIIMVFGAILVVL